MRVTMVGLLWIIVTLAPASHSCAAMSCADVPAPITMLRSPPHWPSSRASATWSCRPPNRSRPRAKRLVISRSDTVGAGPDVQIHDGCIGIEPVGHPVLGCEARPRLGERQVWHVVVPNGRVQREDRKS